METKLKQSIIIDGRRYRSVKDACEQMGFNYNRLQNRSWKEKIKAGELLLRWIEHPEEAEANYERHKRQKVCVNGIWYPSLEKACEEHGFSIKLLNSRYGKGGFPDRVSILEQWISNPEAAKKKTKGTPITIKGTTYPSIKEACKTLGFSYSRLTYCSTCTGESMKNLLVKWGENPNLAKPTPKNPLVINGVMYNNRAEACSQLGIPKNLVRSLMRTKKWSQEKAILHCLSLPKEELGPVLRVTINGQTYPNLVEACKALGYVPDTLYATATKNGISSEKQLQKWVNEQYKPERPPIKTISVIISGQTRTWPSLVNACDTLGYGKSRGIFRHLAKQMGADTTPEEIVAKLLPIFADGVTLDGTYYPTLREVCVAHQITVPALYRALIGKSLPLSEAIRKAKTDFQGSRKPWSDEENQNLKKYYPVFGGDEFVKAFLGQTSRQIDGRVKRIGLLKLKEMVETPFFKLLAYRGTDGNSFFYWFYDRRFGEFMLLNPDEILSFISQPSGEFVKQHKLPDFLFPPAFLLKKAASFQKSPYPG